MEQTKTKNTVTNNNAANITPVKKLMLYRKTYTKQDGTEQFEYFVKGLIRGKEVKVGFMPKVNKMDKDAKWQSDGRSYQVLDFVFGENESVDLLIEEKERVDEKTGEVIPYSVYTAFSKDELGDYECDVKPIQPSDKALLVMILKQKSIAEAKQAVEIPFETDEQYDKRFDAEVAAEAAKEAAAEKPAAGKKKTA